MDQSPIPGKKYYFSYYFSLVFIIIYHFQMGPKQMSFRDLMKQQKASDDEEEGSSNQRQDFYAGSGQNIVGSGNNNDNNDGLVSSILDQARQNAKSQQEQPTSSAFTGKPRTLFDNGTSNTEEPVERKVTKVVLVFWSNGFSVSPEGLSSRFFPSEDARSQRILRNIQMGLAPLREFGMESGMDVSMQIDDSHRSVPYDEAELEKVISRILPSSPKTQKSAFTGSGQKLSSSSSSSTSAATSIATTASASSDWPTFPIDASQPTTRLQIRFGGNQR